MEDKKKNLSTVIYLAIIFALAVGVGMLGKNIAKANITVGFEDNQFKTIKMPNDLDAIEEKLKKEEEEKANQQGAGPVPTPSQGATGESCAQ